MVFPSLNEVIKIFGEIMFKKLYGFMIAVTVLCHSMSQAGENKTEEAFAQTEKCMEEAKAHSSDMIECTQRMVKIGDDLNKPLDKLDTLAEDFDKKWGQPSTLEYVVNLFFSK